MSEMVEPSFLWLHIKKGGGQSFRKTFSPPYVLTDRKNPKPFCAVPRKEWNDMLNNYKLPLGEYDYKRLLFAKSFLYTTEEWERFYKFVIVRNPYDRAVSCWNYLAEPPRERWHHLLGSHRRHMQRHFVAFLEALPSVWESKRQRRLATHTAPIWSDITDGAGNLLVDEIFKLEELAQHLPRLCERIGVEYRPFAHVRGGGGRQKDYAFYYTDQARRLVEDLYRDDIEKLGYAF